MKKEFTGKPIRRTLKLKKKRGNPAWYRGMPSANPKGRPRDQNSWAVFCQNSQVFLIKHTRWWRFSYEHIMTAANGAEAARRAGYSRKSARFIASRLIKKDVIRATRNRMNELSCHPLDRPRFAEPYARWNIRWKHWGL